MRHRTDPVTFALITAVTLLIWYWAAGETRDRIDVRGSVRLQVVADASWQVRPENLLVTAEFEGSRSSLRAARTALAGLVIDVPPGANDAFALDLVDEIARHPDIRATGATVAAVDPPTAEVRVERLVRRRAEVVPMLPGIETTEPPEVRPPSVLVTLPESLANLLPEGLAVEPMLTDRRRAELEPGRAQELVGVPVRISGYDGSLEDVRFEPPLVTVEVTVQSQTAVLDVPRPVRVNLLVAPEDEELVRIDPPQLNGVRIEASSDILEQVASGEAIVLAQLHLLSREREARIRSKRIGGFVVVLPNGRLVPVQGRILETDEPRPEISLEILRRGEGD